MKLDGRQIGTRSLDGKFAKAAQALKDNPYEVISCRPDRDAEPDAYLIAPRLFRMMVDYWEAYNRLTGMPDFSELRNENARLRLQVETLLAELKGRMGENEHLSEGCWRRLKESFTEALDEKTRPWAAVESTIE